MLATPAVSFLTVFFIVPAASLLLYSVLTQGAGGNIAPPVTLTHFLHLASTPLYVNVFLVTLRISALTSLLALVIGIPVAMVIARGHPAASRIATIVVVAPLMVSIVVRTYGWQLLLANSPNGVLNWLLHQAGFPRVTTRLLYTEAVVVIGSLHVFLPMMVLPLAASLARIAPSLEEAARTLGASSARVFLSVTLPLVTPGLMTGLTFVFSLTASSYVTPALLGGNRALMLGNLLDQQVTGTYNWPLGAAIAVAMVAMVFAVDAAAKVLVERRSGRLTGPAGAR